MAGEPVTGKAGMFSSMCLGLMMYKQASAALNSFFVGVPGPAGGVIASVLLTLPFFKHVFAWSACLPASKALYTPSLAAYFARYKAALPAKLPL